MADNTSQTCLTKAAKKNKKKKNKKGASSTGSGSGNSGIDLTEILQQLKAQLDEAKAEKDHKKAGKLRDQVWVLTDVIAGVKTDLPDEELEEILKSLPLPVNNEPTVTAAPPSTEVVTPTDRRLKNLQKKLDQIVKLKEKQTSGQKLEENQLEKIKNEEKIRQEIEELEEIMKSVL